MEFPDLSDFDAERYRACVEADGPIRLAELAKFLRADRVDLTQFDASLESLVPLWEWFVSFAKSGFPGVPIDARPRAEIVDPGDPNTKRQRYAAELLMHYMFEISRGLLRDVAWVIEKQKRVMNFHCTEMQRVNDDGVRLPYPLDSYCRGHVMLLMNGKPGTDGPEYFLNRALESPFALGSRTTQRILATPRSGVSILEELGDPGPALPPLVFPSVADVAAPEAGSGIEDGGDEFDDDDSVGDELMLAHPKANPEDMSRAKPLDVKAVAVALNALGCSTMNGESVTAAGILVEDFAEFLREDNAAMFATECHGGKLRAVHVDAIEPSRQQWDQIMTVLQELASKLKARLARSEEFYSEDME